jgi:DNA-binding NtrC family response regulator
MMNKLKILAVDDEQNVLNTIKEFCLDYDVTTEILPLKAVERINKDMFDIIIVDYQMPIVNGIEFLEETKEVYVDKTYVSIFCTAHGTMHLFEKERISGLFDFFIEKPFQEDKFKKVLDKAIAIMDPKVSTGERVFL